MHETVAEDYQRVGTTDLYPVANYILYGLLSGTAIRRSWLPLHSLTSQQY